MSTAAAHRHEGDEREDPRNRLLDAFDVLVESLKDNGLEPQLRARFERILPPDVPAPAAEAERALNFTVVLQALKANGRRRYSETEIDLIRRAREIVVREMEAA